MIVSPRISFEKIGHHVRVQQYHKSGVLHAILTPLFGQELVDILGRFVFGPEIGR